MRTAKWGLGLALLAGAILAAGPAAAVNIANGTFTDPSSLAFGAYLSGTEDYGYTYDVVNDSSAHRPPSVEYRVERRGASEDSLSPRGPWA